MWRDERLRGQREVALPSTTLTAFATLGMTRLDKALA